MKVVLLCLASFIATAYCASCPSKRGLGKPPSLFVSFDKDERKPRRVIGEPYEFAILPPAVTVANGHLDDKYSVEGEAMLFNGDYYLQARDGAEIRGAPGCLTDWEKCKKGATILTFIDPVNSFTENSVQETIFRFGDSKDKDTSFGLTVTISRRKIYVWADGEESHARLECSPHADQGPDIIASGWFQLAVRIVPKDNGGAPRASVIKPMLNFNLMNCEVKELNVDIAPRGRRANTIYIAGDNPDRMPRFGPYYGTMDHFLFYDTDLGIPGVRDVYRAYKKRLEELNN